MTRVRSTMTARSQWPAPPPRPPPPPAPPARPPLPSAPSLCCRSPSNPRGAAEPGRGREAALRPLLQPPLRWELTSNLVFIGLRRPSHCNMWVVAWLTYWQGLQKDKKRQKTTRPMRQSPISLGSWSSCLAFEEIDQEGIFKLPIRKQYQTKSFEFWWLTDQSL